MFSAWETYEKQLRIEKTRLSHQVWSHGGSTLKKKRTLNGHFSRPAETDPYKLFMLPCYFQLGWYFWADKSFVEYIVMCRIIAANFIFRRWSASTERINSAMKPWSPGATVIFDFQCSSDLLLPSKIFD